MLSASRFLAVLAAIGAATTALAGSPNNVFNPQLVVLGRDGQVLDHVDPSQYLYIRKQPSSAPPLKRAFARPRLQHSDAEPIEVDSVVPTHETPIVSSKLSIVQVSAGPEERDDPIQGEQPSGYVVDVKHIEAVIVQSTPPPIDAEIEQKTSTPHRDGEPAKHHEIDREIRQVSACQHEIDPVL